ncbi:hypothetical protein C7S15_8590 [Burkholderia cepacia]|nr:hypothetical protein [Burkholderia cepacia]
MGIAGRLPRVCIQPSGEIPNMVSILALRDFVGGRRLL